MSKKKAELAIDAQTEHELETEIERIANEVQALNGKKLALRLRLHELQKLKSFREGLEREASYGEAGSK